MLEVRGLESFYGASQALFGVDFDVGAGEVVTMLGRNGMGKTTTLHSVIGIVAPHAGMVRFAGSDVTALPPFRTANLGIGLVPEGRQIFPNLTVRENLVATASNHQNLGDPWTLEKVFEMFPDLAARSSSMGNLLSGGEQQMLAIGRALMTNPSLLVLDEATEGLAPLIRKKIWDALAVIRDSGLSILVVDKNIKDLLRLADRHFVMEKGKVVWSGSSGQLKQAEDVQHRYLGV